MNFDIKRFKVKYKKIENDNCLTEKNPKYYKKFEEDFVTIIKKMIDNGQKKKNSKDDEMNDFDEWNRFKYHLREYLTYRTILKQSLINFIFFFSKTWPKK